MRSCVRAWGGVVLLAWFTAACTPRQSAGNQCSYSSDCAEGLSCVTGTCRPQCQADRDCPASGLCVLGPSGASRVCINSAGFQPLCRSDGECTPDNGRLRTCAPPGVCVTQCVQDPDCSSFAESARCSAVGRCYLPTLTPGDGGAEPSPDAAADAPLADAPLDATPEAALDAAPEVGLEAALDAPAEVTLDAPLEASEEASTDASTDATPVGDVLTVPGPTRPLAPLTTTHVTTQRPTLRWVQGASDTAPTGVRLCRDAALTAGCSTLPVVSAAMSVRPSSPLAAGLWFWRLEGTMRGASAPVWQFAVPARDSAVDTSWGTWLDVNGDGLADLAVGEMGASANRGAVLLFHGNRTAMPTTPQARVDGPGGSGAFFGNAIASAGDVNGDGYTDLVVGAYVFSSSTGAAYVFHGSAAGLSTTASRTLLGAAAGSSFGVSVASAGDVNGDGFADLLVGAPGNATVAGHAYLYLGSATGIASAPARVFDSPAAPATGTSFGTSVAGGFDTNGDGLADLLVGASGEGGGAGAAYLFLGHASLFAASPEVTVLGAGGTTGRLGASVACAGDLNGDGLADLAVGAPANAGATGQAQLFLGRAGMPASTASASLLGIDGALGQFGSALAGVGDLDADGFDDLSVAASAVSGNRGRVHVYRGGPSGPGSTPDWSLDGAALSSNFLGRSLAGAGDVNGDGYPELAVGTLDGVAGMGRAFLFSGSSTGLRSTPLWNLPGTDGTGANFGCSVADARSLRGRAPAALYASLLAPRAL